MPRDNRHGNVLPECPLHDPEAQQYNQRKAHDEPLLKVFYEVTESGTRLTCGIVGNARASWLGLPPRPTAQKLDYFAGQVLRSCGWSLTTVSMHGIALRYS